MLDLNAIPQMGASPNQIVERKIQEGPAPMY